MTEITRPNQPPSSPTLPLASVGAHGLTPDTRVGQLNHSADVCSETRRQRLDDAEAQVARCMLEFMANADKPSALARGESFRAAVMYRNRLMTPAELLSVERKRWGR